MHFVVRHFKRHPSNFELLKRLYLLISFLYSVPLFGQTNCAIGIIPNSNEISYNQNEIDSTLELSKYDAFFLGETHTVDFEPEFKFHFIKHLNSKYGVKDIFMEIGYSAAYFFNQYLQTGDTNILQTNRLPYLWGKYKIFWKNLRIYNSTLPDNLKIVVHGIDFERIEIFKLLEKARDTSIQISENLRQTFETIYAKSSDNNLVFGDKEFTKTLSSMKEIFSKHTVEFKLLFKNNYSIVKNSLNNISNANSSFSERNENWLINLTQIIIDNKISKFIGFFGTAHTRYNNKASLTVAIKNSNFFKGNILNIATVYSHYSQGGNQIFEYGHNEVETFEHYYNKNCRAVIVKSSEVPKLNFKTESDFIIFAKDIMDR